MSDTPLRTWPPADLQLKKLRELCEERGLPMPAPHSSTEASILIGEVLRREYRPPEWDEDVPF